MSQAAPRPEILITGRTEPTGSIQQSIGFVATTIPMLSALEISRNGAMRYGEQYFEVTMAMTETIALGRSLVNEHLARLPIATRRYRPQPGHPATSCVVLGWCGINPANYHELSWTTHSFPPRIAHLPANWLPQLLPESSR